MPCYDNYGLPSICDHSDLKRRNDELAQILCLVGRWADLTGRGGDMPPQFVKWWRAHKEVDRKRLVREQKEREKNRLAQKARAKLTIAERKALGLN